MFAPASPRHCNPATPQTLEIAKGVLRAKCLVGLHEQLPASINRVVKYLDLDSIVDAPAQKINLVVPFHTLSPIVSAPKFSPAASVGVGVGTDAASCGSILGVVLVVQDTLVKFVIVRLDSKIIIQFEVGHDYGECAGRR